ncbi:MAG: CocE/NonD family hydrolase [Armatimonadota bacterium]|nr:MAG: CocE/NonD family hydrolase [Armatimonadota bacterium]
MSVQSSYLTMRDGVRIAIDLYLPDEVGEGEKLPTILHQTRYFRRMDLRWPAGLLVPADGYAALGTRKGFVTRGYAWVSVDVRGTGASYGHRVGPYPTEQVEDAAEIVDWITRQPWSNGKVGALGISYDAGAAELLLANKHPAVNAIAPQFMLFDTYTDIVCPGGIPLTWFLKNWGSAVDSLDRNAVGDLGGWMTKLLLRGVRPVDADRDRSMLAAAVRDHVRNWNVYEMALTLTYRDDALPYQWPVTIDSFSPHAHKQDIESSRAAIYSYSGWLDGAYAHAAIKRFLTLSNPGSRLIIGPWDHAGRHNISPSVRSIARFDHTAELLRFFDYHLKGVDTGIADEEPVRYYTMIEDRWKHAASWPPPQTSMATYYLRQDNSLSTDKPDAANGYDTYRVDYSAGSGRLTRWESLLDELPDATRYPDRAEQDNKLLTYTSQPLERDTEVTGHPVMTLYASSTATDGNFFVYLEDVAEDGNVTYVTEGGLRAIHRTLSEREPPYRQITPYRTFERQDAMPLVPGETAELVFDLMPTSYLFKQGHSIRVALGGADKDHFAVPAGAPPSLRFHRDRIHASHIDVPTVPR